MHVDLSSGLITLVRRAFYARGEDDDVCVEHHINVKLRFVWVLSSSTFKKVSDAMRDTPWRPQADFVLRVNEEAPYSGDSVGGCCLVMEKRFSCFGKYFCFS